REVLESVDALLHGARWDSCVQRAITKNVPHCSSHRRRLTCYLNYTRVIPPSQAERCYEGRFTEGARHTSNTGHKPGPCTLWCRAPTVPARRPTGGTAPVRAAHRWC